MHLHRNAHDRTQLIGITGTSPSRIRFRHLRAPRHRYRTRNWLANGWRGKYSVLRPECHITASYWNDAVQTWSHSSRRRDTPADVGVGDWVAGMMECLDIHFLNVGHGDCTIVVFPSGNLTMIDINNSMALSDDDELELAAQKGITLESFRKAAFGKVSWEEYYKSLLVDPTEYFQEKFEGKGLFRYIQTHPDMDHMSGLCRFFWEEKINVLNFWDSQNTKAFEESKFNKSRYNWNDWLTYCLMRKGRVQEGNAHKVIHNLQGNTGDHWSSDGITVLSPTQKLVDTCNDDEAWNDVSYVLRIDYGGRAIILAGDAEESSWGQIESTYDSSDLKCDILKAAHHGRLSGYSETAIDSLDPALVICSVGKKPGTDATAEYKAHGAQVLSTRYCGTIVARIWADGEVWVYNSDNEKVFELPVLS